MMIAVATIISILATIITFMNNVKIAIIIAIVIFGHAFSKPRLLA